MSVSGPIDIELPPHIRWSDLPFGLWPGARMIENSPGMVSHLFYGVVVPGLSPTSWNVSWEWPREDGPGKTSMVTSITGGASLVLDDSLGGRTNWCALVHLLAESVGDPLPQLQGIFIDFYADSVEPGGWSLGDQHSFGSPKWARGLANSCGYESVDELKSVTVIDELEGVTEPVLALCIILRFLARAKMAAEPVAAVG